MLSQIQFEHMHAMVSFMKTSALAHEHQLTSTRELVFEEYIHKKETNVSQ
jgi:hypothetical protein